MVKRWFAALAAGFAVCLGGMVCAAEEPPAVIQFFDGAGGQLRFLTEGAVTVRAVLPEDAGEAVLVAAVKRGDTLWGIAKRFGVNLTALIAANPQIKNPNLIYPGNEVRLP